MYVISCLLVQVVERIVQLQERQAHVDKQLNSEGARLFKELQVGGRTRTLIYSLIE